MLLFTSWAKKKQVTSFRFFVLGSKLYTFFGLFDLKQILMTVQVIPARTTGPAQTE